MYNGKNTASHSDVFNNVTLKSRHQIAYQAKLQPYRQLNVRFTCSHWLPQLPLVSLFGLCQSEFLWPHHTYALNVVINPHKFLPTIQLIRKWRGVRTVNQRHNGNFKKLPYLTYNSSTHKKNSSITYNKLSTFSSNNVYYNF